MADAYPYHVPSAEAVRPGPWMCMRSDSEEPLPDHLPAWDVSEQLAVSRRMDTDLSLVIAESRLPRLADMALSVLLNSGYEQEVCRQALHPGEPQATQLRFHLSGDQLGETVVLTTSLLLADSVPATSARVAWRRGSILWKDTKKVRLYGDASRFPLIQADFANRGFDPGAPWFVDVDSDPQLPAMGSIMLYLNDRFPRVIDAAKELRSDDAELRAIRSMMFTDVGRVMVEHGLALELPNDDWPDESLGAVIAALIGRFNETPTELKAIHSRDPARWGALVAAKFGLLAEDR